MTKKIAFHTLGCKVNRYETDAVAKTFIDGGYNVVDFNEIAKVYIINTCTVTGEADRKSRQLLRQAKKRCPDSIVVAMGCHVELSDASSYADVIIGNSDKSRVFEIIENYLKDYNKNNNRNENYSDNDNYENDEKILDEEKSKPDLADKDNKYKNYTKYKTVTKDINNVKDFEELGIVTSLEDTRAYIKIEDGCNNFCSYCAIPLARGRVRSRGESAIIAEAIELAKNGFKEIVLTGIHVCSYGEDRNESSDALIDLTARISEIPGIERIRFGSLEPQSISNSFVEKASAIKSICPHFHLSLQSGSDSVLKRMNRRYNTKEYENVASMLRKNFKNCTITTDIITGFPGETQEEHIQTVDFCRKIGFSSIHVFKYSERKGTNASKMQNKVDPQTINVRSKELLELSLELKKQQYKSYLGETFNVLIEKINDGFASGYTENYLFTRIINIDEFSSKTDMTGGIVSAVVIDYEREYLVCKIVDFKC